MPNQQPSLRLIAIAVGMRVANPYYAQSLLPAVERTFQLVPGQVLVGPMVSQLGIATDLLLVLPLGDRSDRRRILMLLALAMAVACRSVVTAPSYGMLLGSWFALGLAALIPSLIPPFLAAITPEAIRGRMLGLVLSGQFTGILLSRSMSGVLGQRWGWRAIYALSALAMIGVTVLFGKQLPAVPPSSRESYWQLQESQLALWRRHPCLRLRCSSSGWSTLGLRIGEHGQYCCSTDSRRWRASSEGS